MNQNETKKPMPMLPEQMKAALEGWTFRRMDNVFKQIAILAPNGYRAIVSKHDRNPENVLYMLADAVLGAAEKAAAQQVAGRMRESFAMPIERLATGAGGDECHHDETVRLGVIWTRCEQCGGQWADDDPGSPFRGKELASQWRLVPVKPTATMCGRLAQHLLPAVRPEDMDSAEAAWKAALAAAPAPVAVKAQRHDGSARQGE